MEEEYTETLLVPEIEVLADENGEKVEIEGDEEPLDKSASGSEKQRLVRLPLARVKNLIKMDPDCGIVSQDAVFLVTKATELFISYISQHIAEEATNCKRKTVMKKDVNAVVGSVPKLCFLDGALE